MTPRLKVSTALSEEFPAPPGGGSQSPVITAPGDPMPLTFTCMYPTHTHTKRQTDTPHIHTQLKMILKNGHQLSSFYIVVNAISYPEMIKIIVRCMQVT